MDYTYDGFYTRFDTASKDAGGLLMGADTLVGDVFTVDFRTDANGSTTAWLVNRFGGDLGFLSAADTYRLQVAAARGLSVRALLSFVAYTEDQTPSPYWGEVAVVCTPANDPDFEEYLRTLGKNMASGVRPSVSLGEPEIRKIAETGGTWLPAERVALPERKPGTAFVKTQRSITENMVEQGRRGNVGCYIVSIAFIVAVVLGVIYFLGRMIGFF